MSGKISRIASVVFAVLLVTSATVSPVGTAAAAEPGNCSDLDDFVMFLTLGAVNAEDCSRQAYVDAAVEDMEQADANQTKVDIYSAAGGQKASSETWVAPFNNYVNDTESVAWMKAQTAIAEAYQNGSSKAEAKVAAREAISSYYATKQQNLIEHWNVTAASFDTLRSQAEQETGINAEYVGLNESYSTDRGWSGGGPVYSQTVVRSASLVDGSTQNYTALEVYGEAGYHGSDRYYAYLGPNSDWEHTSYSYDYYVHALRVNPPNDNYDKLFLYRPEMIRPAWERIEAKNTQLQNETDTFVDATWDDFDNGRIEASGVISSNTAMFEYGVRSGNESESLYNSVGALALMGFDTPNVNDSGTMSVTYDGVTYEGIVLAESAPNGSWTAGQTYNTSNITGPVFMATTDGDKVDFANNTEFTIESMTAKDGSDLGSIDTKRYAYKTANTSELLAMQDELTALRAELEARQLSSDTSGGGGSSGGSLPTKYVLFALAAGAAYVLFVEPDDGGGGNY